MKMTLKNRIAQSLEVLDNCKSRGCMHSNDVEVVFYAARILGSNLSRRYNKILMGRNALPLWWYDNSKLCDCTINFGLKRGFIKVVEYSKEEYSITSGRVKNLMGILNEKSREFFGIINYHADKEKLIRFLRKLNNQRMVYEEMTESEIYDFSFDMVYELVNEFSLSNETLALSFLIMYWIQWESKLIPLALRCDKNDFLKVLYNHSEETLIEKEGKKKFRLFMRKVLDLHLRVFIRNETKDSEIKPTSRDRILNLIKDNPTFTAKMIAANLGLSVQAVQKQIAILKKEKRLKRIGPDHGGRWMINNKNLEG